MTKQEHGVAYEKCTWAELMQFVISRRLKPEGTTLEELVHTLRTADLNATFRFFDLSEEIRNVVYREPLELQQKRDSERRCCWASIISTCSQARKEAQSILYEDNAAHMSIASSSDYYVSSPTTAVNGMNVDVSSITEMRWPSFLQKIGTIHIRCVINTSPETWTMMKINRILYRLSNFLLANPSPKGVKIEVAGLKKPRISELRDMLAPVCFFGPLAQLDFHGVSLATAKSLSAASALQKRAERGDVFERLSSLTREVESFLSLESVFYAMPKEIINAQKNLAEVRSITRGSSGMITGSLDEKLRKQLVVVKEALEKVNVEEVERGVSHAQERFAECMQEGLARFKAERFLRYTSKTSMQP